MSLCNTALIEKTSDKKQLPWVEKYRPKTVDEIISHQEIIKSLKRLIEMKSLPHLLFFGPSGSGKTSTIKCCASQIYGEYIDCMILELNASNERGIETVRTKIKNFVGNKNSIFLPKDAREVFKLVILDEIDSMTVEAQGMLRQTIEKNSASTRFCLICNDIDKINIALQSRCTLFRFAPLSVVDMRTRLHDICILENIKYDEDAIDAIMKITKGDMRSAINTLQHIKQTINNKISTEHVYKISGHCMPKINNKIFNKLTSLSANKSSLRDCVDDITNIVIEYNITIFNLLDELKNIIMESKLTTNQKIYIIDNLAQNEIYDSVNVDPKIIIMILASIFVSINGVK